MVPAALLVAVALFVAAPAQAQDAVEPGPGPARPASAEEPTSPEKPWGTGRTEHDGPPDEPTADQRRQARQLFREGVGYAREHRWGEALEYFRRSRALVARPTTLFNIGVALLRLGRPTAALDALDDYLRVADPERDAKRVEHARKMLEMALRTTAELELEVEPPEATVRVDGQIASGTGSSRQLRLDPGDHRLEVSAEGYLDASLEVSLLPGETASRAVVLDAAPEPRGQLIVTSNVPKAVISLDGEPMGDGTLRQELSPGTYRLSVRAPGFAPFQRTIRVEGGRALELHAALEPGEESRPVWRRTPFWVGTAAAVLGVAAAVGIGVAVRDDTADPYGGSTGVVLQGLSAR
jgi:hypothetical protein